MSNHSYTYRSRKGYQSSEMLIEFIHGAESSHFIHDLLTTLSSVKFKVISHENSAMDDEVVMNITSDCGDFQLSRDIWGSAFILPVKNQGGIQQIDEILSCSALFLKKV